MKNFQLFYIVYSVHHSSFSTIQPTNAHNCHLIHNNIFKNTKILHVLDLTGPPSGNTFTGVMKNSCLFYRTPINVLPGGG